MKLHEMRKGDATFHVRDHTLDEWVVDEVFGGYYSYLDIWSGDVVLDIGMNIGAFSVLAGMQGARVVGFEPESENFGLAVRNMEANGLEGSLFQQGISDADRTVRLFLNTRKNRGSHSTIPVKGRRTVYIECVDINAVLAEHKPTKLKMDCEGAEYDVLMAVEDWHSVEKIVVEWHRRMLRDESNEMFDEVVAHLERDFKVVAKRDATGWYQKIKCARRL